MSQLDILKTELTTDPLGRGYSGMTDAQAADSLNVADRAFDRTSLSGSEIYNALVPSEFQSLTAAQKEFVRDVFSLGDAIDVSTGTNARTVLLSAFGAGTTTRINLGALVASTRSRADELGLSRVREGTVADARIA